MDLFELTAHAPMIEIYGAFFPIWIIAAIIGIVGAIMVRRVVIKTGAIKYIKYASLFHLSVGVILGVLAYLIWTGGYG